MRLVGRLEAQRGMGALTATVQALGDAVASWRNMRGEL